MFEDGGKLATNASRGYGAIANQLVHIACVEPRSTWPRVQFPTPGNAHLEPYAVRGFELERFGCPSGLRATNRRSLSGRRDAPVVTALYGFRADVLLEVPG